jgi:hypothetical protein
MGEKIDGRYRVEHSVHAFSKHGYFVNFKAVRVGKKKPPKPPKDGKHTWSTDDDDPEAKARGRDDKQGEGSKDKRNLRHLVLAYDSGPSVDAAADADWDKKNNKPDVDDLEFKYRWSVDGPTAEEQLDWAKVKNETLEKLRFGLVEAESESDEHVADRTKADHKPQLQGLSEQIVGSAGGGGSGSGDT